jgi:hypothetical protein
VTKPKTEKAKKAEDHRPSPVAAGWEQSYATYLTGCSYIDGTDALAIELEAKWGCDRLRLLVPQDYREKFDRQRLLYHSAITNGTLEDVRREAVRMATAWRTCDSIATDSGAAPRPPERWEVSLEDGTGAVLVPDSERAALVRPDGRSLAVYTLAEIGRLLGHYRQIVAAKLTCPGAEVTAIRQSVGDPLRWMPTGVALDDAIADDELPF